MSKGKSAAKGAAPTVVENPDGAKFATVRLGTSEHPITMLINLNCPVDIILDNVKRLMVKRIDAFISDIHNSPEMDTPQSIVVEEPPAVRENPVVMLQDIKDRLLNADCYLDLCDQSGTSTNCREHLKKLGCENILVHNAVYDIVSVDAEGTSQSCFIAAAPAEEPQKSPTKKK